MLRPLRFCMADYESQTRQATLQPDRESLPQGLASPYWLVPHPHTILRWAKTPTMAGRKSQTHLSILT